ncbi:MAG TPA: hypothetical protein H9867_07715 [Candidatus Corynebacterium gallistercoris]|uniref:Alpha/beta hydrolase n=1 Tax=Candidatus Corynebacterium gallistercoris TaxID=2838530 RepID=A0A9D1RXJ4_9CORY|nr:hypothetical protein [Candidatus Corynebacterium gallistercoris]
MSEQTPNSDIVNLPGSGRDVQEGVEPLNELEQLQQLNNYFEDHYPEIFRSLTVDEGAEYRDKGEQVSADLVDATERMWARVPDLLSHTSLLVLGAGLDHSMPHVAQIGPGTSVQPWTGPELPEGVVGQVIRPSQPTGVLAVSLHGGPGWFGDGVSHDQFWVPLFAAIAEASGTTVVDLTYPLPGYGDWTPTQEAVAQAVEIIRSEESRQFGLITFGSGFIAAAGCLTAERTQPDFVVALSPRITKELADQERMRVNGLPVLLSAAEQDSRGTSLATAQDVLQDLGADLTVQSWTAEHIIAPPSVWRERVAAAARWITQR